MTERTNATLAIACGVAIIVLQGGRVLLWGYWPPLLQLPIDADGDLLGALLIWAGLRSRKQSCMPLLTAAWGVTCGVGYRTFFEQVADPRRHAGHELLVLAVKGALLLMAIVVLTRALRSSGSKAAA